MHWTVTLNMEQINVTWGPVLVLKQQPPKQGLLPTWAPGFGFHFDLFLADLMNIWSFLIDSTMIQSQVLPLGWDLSLLTGNLKARKERRDGEKSHTGWNAEERPSD